LPREHRACAAQGLKDGVRMNSVSINPGDDRPALGDDRLRIDGREVKPI
jgi:hypothetical protein